MKGEGISRYARPHLAKVAAYVPGEQPAGEDWIKLNTNELPYGPPAAVGEAVAKEVSRLHRYPEPLSRDLRAALARHHRVAEEQVVAGNGSDELLNLLVRAFGGGGRKIGQVVPSYSLYPVLAAIGDARVAGFELERGFRLPEALEEGHGCSLFFLTNPNAPSGVRFGNESIRRLARVTDGILVVDEAYAEFADGDARALLATEPNVVITRTFSKAYGLAGLRVGYALGPAEVVAVLDRIRDSYNVNRVSQAGVLAALGEQAYYDGLVGRVRATRERVAGALRELGWQVWPSETNFLLVEPRQGGGAGSPEAAAGFFDFLRGRRILVRRFPDHPLTACAVRVTMGSDEEMNPFLEAARIWAKQEEKHG